jgi:hypothetical protein
VGRPSTPSRALPGWRRRHSARLKTGKRRLAVEHLAPLARALRTSVNALLTPEPRVDPRVRRRARTVKGLRVLPLSRDRGPG